MSPKRLNEVITTATSMLREQPSRPPPCAVSGVAVILIRGRDRTLQLPIYYETVDADRTDYAKWLYRTLIVSDSKFVKHVDLLFVWIQVLCNLG